MFPALGRADIGVAGTLLAEELIMPTVSEIPVGLDELRPIPEEGREPPMGPGFVTLRIRG